LALPFAAMIQGIVGNWGHRFEIVEDPLVGVPVAKTKKTRRFFN